MEQCFVQHPDTHSPSHDSGNLHAGSRGALPIYALALLLHHGARAGWPGVAASWLIRTTALTAVGFFQQAGRLTFASLPQATASANTTVRWVSQLHRSATRLSCSPRAFVEEQCCSGARDCGESET